MLSTIHDNGFVRDKLPVSLAYLHFFFPSYLMLKNVLFSLPVFSRLVLKMSLTFFLMEPQIRRRSSSVSTWPGKANRPAGMSSKKRWKQNWAAPLNLWSATGWLHPLKVTILTSVICLQCWSRCICSLTSVLFLIIVETSRISGNTESAERTQQSQQYDDIYFDTDSDEDSQAGKITKRACSRVKCKCFIYMHSCWYIVCINSVVVQGYLKSSKKSSGKYVQMTSCYMTQTKMIVIRPG